MPRYHFHRTGDGFIPDTEGTELPGFDAARTEAVRYAGETMRDRPDYVWNNHDFRVEVTDEGGALLCTVRVLGIDAAAPRAK